MIAHTLQKNSKNIRRQERVHCDVVRGCDATTFREQTYWGQGVETKPLKIREKKAASKNRKNDLQ